jgi:hypothetical protein
MSRRYDDPARFAEEAAEGFVPPTEDAYRHKDQTRDGR